MPNDRGQSPDKNPASDANVEDSDWILLGRISGQFGIQGWVKVFSHTSPRENILQYRSWYLNHSGSWEPYRLKNGKLHSKGVVAHLEGCNDRDQAIELMNADIAIPRDQLPAAAEDEYYWRDLEGLQVRTLDGTELGRVEYLFETGANDVMVVKGDSERLLPFVDQVIKSVDLEGGIITVDWDPDY